MGLSEELIHIFYFFIEFFPLWVGLKSVQSMRICLMVYGPWHAVHIRGSYFKEKRMGEMGVGNAKSR